MQLRNWPSPLSGPSTQLALLSSTSAWKHHLWLQVRYQDFPAVWSVFAQDAVEIHQLTPTKQHLPILQCLPGSEFSLCSLGKNIRSSAAQSIIQNARLHASAHNTGVQHQERCCPLWGTVHWLLPAPASGSDSQHITQVWRTPPSEKHTWTHSKPSGSQDLHSSNS